MSVFATFQRNRSETRIQCLADITLVSLELLEVKECMNKSITLNTGATQQLATLIIHPSGQTQGYRIQHPNQVILAPYGTNLGLFKISFSTKLNLKKSQNCPIWGQSDPIWMTNSTSLHTAGVSNLAFHWASIWQYIGG